MIRVQGHAVAGEFGTITFETREFLDSPRGLGRFGWRIGPGFPWHIGFADRRSAVVAALADLLPGPIDPEAAAEAVGEAPAEAGATRASPGREDALCALESFLQRRLSSR